MATLGKETFDLNKGEYTAKLGRIISNHRVNSRLIGESAEFVLRSCRLTSQWSKLGATSGASVYLRNIELAAGRKVKMLSLEVGATKQPVSKAKLVDALYPAKKIATSATEEEKNYNKVKASMRGAVSSQLKKFRSSVELPLVCYLSGAHIRRGTKTDVDHVGVSFSELADSFLSSKGLRYTDIALIGPVTAKKFKNAALWQEWQEYHREHAKYALVLASANRSKGCEDYSTPSGLYGSFKSESPEEMSLDF
jgi:hypothetical protein